jgi:hypothetical protein
MNQENQPKLFELIKSMTMSEKRYFKLSASLHKGETNNMKLFDAIEEQSVYSEATLIEKLKGESFVKDLPVAKNALYNHILKILRDYNSSDSDRQQMRNLLTEAEIVKQKGLFDHYEALLIKAKKIAYKFEKFQVVAEIICLQKGLLFSRDPKKKQENSLEELIGEENIILSRYGKEVKFRNILCRIQDNYYSNNIPRSEEEIQSFKALAGDDLEFIIHMKTGEEDEQLSYTAKYECFSSKMLYYYAMGDEEQAYQSTLQLIAMMDRHANHPNLQIGSYILTYSNLGTFCMRLKKFDECHAAISKIRNMQVTSADLKGMIFKLSYEKELKMYVNSGHFQKGMDLIPEVEKGLKIHEKTITDIYLFSIWASYSELYFGNGNYTQAAQWLNKMLNHPGFKNSKIDFQCYARILSVVVQYEMGKQDLLEYSIRSTYRFLLMRKKLYKTEFAFLNFFKKKAPRLNSKKLQVEAFVELKAELEGIMKDPFEQQALDLFDFITWLESKITGRPFAEIVIEKSSRVSTPSKDRA